MIAAPLLLAAAAIVGSGPDRPYVTHHENVLGTSAEFKIAAPTPRLAAAAEQAALAEIDRLAKILSAWDAASEFSRWNSTRGRAVPVSPELAEVLGLFDTWRARTGGALNGAAETIGRVWREAEKQRRLPTSAELAAAVQRAAQTHWRVDAAARTATRLSDAPIAFNSLAKGYIIDRAARAAARAGATGVSVNIGGDLTVLGALPRQTTEIADPRADAENAARLESLAIPTGRAVATSGAYRRGYDIAGRHYSHIIDPRTGRTAGGVASVTVIANDPVTAGALATAFSVLGPRESAAVARRVPGVEYMMLASNGRRIASAGWTGVALQTSTATAAGAATTVAVQFTLARIADARYRRPYVAVWIEDKDRFPVRTLALWIEKTRWLPDLKGWYRSDRLRALAENTELTNSVSSATRPPGKYTLQWDLKDQAGQAVKPGRYTLCIEASREHGTYQILRQEVDLSGAAKQFTLAGGTEIESAAIDYRKAR
ncbi:MAG: DUF2271 domain-containing protein [Bryobacterales bacterium]|nr:DUF2271 domain-containing protein [Bryobacterales bacterium]